MSIDPVTELPSRPSPGAAGAQLGELYADHSRLVYGICRMLLRDPDEAEDATQHVFLSAYKNLLTGTQVRDPAAWLGTIARNACRRRATARMREPLAVDDQITLVSPAADEQASGREQTAALYAELAALPEKQREAVVLRDLYGLRYDEVAKALGTSRPAVEALLFRGRRRLQHRLRPGVAAGVLVVPLAVQESIAYAVPGFASTAVPAGAVAAAAGVPLLAKLAAAGAAVGLAGSAGIVTERSLHDRPTPPASEVSVDRRGEPESAASGARDAVILSPSSSSRRAVTTRAAPPAGANGAAKHDGEEDEHDGEHEQVEDLEPAPVAHQDTGEHEVEQKPTIEPAHEHVATAEPSSHLDAEGAPADDGSAAAGDHEHSGEDPVETEPANDGHDG